MTDLYKGKRILVASAAGTEGKELIRQFPEAEPEELRFVDNIKPEAFSLIRAFGGSNGNCFPGDARHRYKIALLCEGVDIVIHVAALKHLIFSEYNPTCVVQTNIPGVENIIHAAKTGGDLPVQEGSLSGSVLRVC